MLLLSRLRVQGVDVRMGVEPNGIEVPNHTPEFWLRVGRALPEYEQRKNWLAEHGGRHVAL